MKTKIILATLALSINAFAQIPTNGLVANYQFNGNANDGSGNNNNGTVNGAALTADRLGNANSAYSFNGSTSYIDIPHSSTLNFTSNAISITFWAKINAVPSNGYSSIILSKQNGSGTTMQGFNVFANTAQTVSLMTSNGGANFGGTGSTNVSLGIYHHFAYTISGGTAISYLDGVQTNISTGQTATIGANTVNLLIGKATWSNINAVNFNGVIDELQIFNRGLNQNEVIAIYNNCIEPTQASTPTGITQLCVNPSNTIYTTTGATIATAYVWEISPSGAGVISGTGTTGTIDWDNAYNGTATISVKGTNGAGCEGPFSNTISVTINPLPIVTFSSLNAVCSNTGSFVLNSATPNGGTYSGTGVSGNIFDASASGIGTFPVTYVYTDGNSCSNSATQNITVNSLPTTTINSVPTFININATPIALVGNPTGGVFTGTGISGNQFNPIVAGLGTKQITYNYTNSGTGCSNTTQVSTIVYDTTGVLCTTFDTTYISVTDTLFINTTLTGINPPNNYNVIKIYPNPASDHITIDNGNIANLTGYQIKIVNSLSQQVFQSSITQQQFYVDLSTWTGNGIYFVHVIDDQGNTIEIKKIVLQ